MSKHRTGLRRRGFAGAGGSKSTPWLLGAGAVVLVAGGFWYFTGRAKAQSRPTPPPPPPPPAPGEPPPFAVPDMTDPTRVLTEQQAWSVYTLGALEAAKSIAINDLARMRLGLKIRTRTGLTPQGSVTQQENLIRELAAAQAAVRAGGGIGESQWRDLTAILRPTFA